MHIGSKNPLEYMREYLDPGYDLIERTHLLPGIIVDWARAAAMPDDALDRFVEARLELVLARLRELLEQVPFEVMDTRSPGGRDASQRSSSGTPGSEA